ncbi:hypothetical protein ACERII_11535 [Evansella sp. AB-rgal1]|uniref:hypothetical protein n=1 Tax=Evansella sp. AB-rgal1 TaxID=3242696 RepID=UPI00359E0055
MSNNQFKLVSVSQMQEMTDDELINYSIDSIRAMKKFEIEFVKVSDEIISKSDLKIDDELITDCFDFSSQHNCKYKYFYYNEMERDRYKKRYFGVKKLPSKDVFLQVVTEKVAKPFGYFKIETMIKNVDRKFNDVVYENLKPDFKNIDKKEFIYDYNLVHQSKRLNKEGEGPDVYYIPLPKNTTKDDARWDILDEREGMIRELERKVRQLDEEFTDNLYDWYLESRKLWKETESYPTIENYDNFFIYFNKIVNKIKERLGVKVCLSHITIEEYDFLIEHIKKMLRHINGNLIITKSDLIRGDETELRLEVTEDLRGQGTNGNKLFLYLKSEAEKQLRFLMPFREPKDKQVPGELKIIFTDGFFIDDTSNNKAEWKIYLTPASINKMRFFTKYSITLDELENIPGKVLEEYKKLN